MRLSYVLMLYVHTTVVHVVPYDKRCFKRKGATIGPGQGTRASTSGEGERVHVLLCMRWSLKNTKSTTQHEWIAGTNRESAAPHSHCNRSHKGRRSWHTIAMITYNTVPHVGHLLYRLRLQTLHPLVRCHHAVDKLMDRRLQEELASTTK